MAPLSRGLRSLLSVQLQWCNTSSARYLNSRSLVVSQEVSEAVKNGSPVVSLESTIITHGMPFPPNLSMARDVEQIIRSAGATPAAVAVIEGTVHVGLSGDQIEELAELKTPAAKTSRRDFPYVISSKVFI